MGCTTSRVTGPGGDGSTKQGPPHRFWPLGSSCSRIEDISMHISKRNGNGMMKMMGRDSSLSDRRLLRPEEDERISVDQRQSVSSIPRQSVSSMPRQSVSSINDNKEVLLPKDEKVVLIITEKVDEKKVEEEKVKECMVVHEELADNEDWKSIDDDEDDEEMAYPRSPSFKVYVRVYNANDKIDGSKELKVDPNMKMMKDLKVRTSASMKKNHVMQPVSEEEPTMNSPSKKKVITIAPTKVKKGRRFGRILPRPTPIKSILGVATGCYNSNHHRSHPNSNDDNKPVEVNN